MKFYNTEWSFSGKIYLFLFNNHNKQNQFISIGEFVGIIERN